MNINIAVMYRASPSESDGPNSAKSRPRWFDKKKCFKSCYDAAKNAGLDFYFMHDGIENHYSEYVKSKDIKEFTNVNNGNGGKTYLDSLALMDKIKDNYTHFYLCEDDYLHLPQSFNILKEGIQFIGNQYLFSLYEHPDRYRRNDDVTFGKEMISVSQTCHWRTVESTCGTFCLNKDVFLKYRNDLETKSDRHMFRTFYEYGIRLWCPMPTMATHMDSRHLSVFVNWQDINNKIEL